jgi:hypothetical protein
MSKLLAYAQCMRSHGISDFPDPTPNPSGTGGGFNFSGSGNNDLSPRNPTFKAANQACQSLLPGGSQTPTQSAREIAAAVELAHCMRSHGVSEFPDPNGDGAFDLSHLDTTSPAFGSALKTCRSLAKFQGAIPVY